MSSTLKFWQEPLNFKIVKCEIVSSSVLKCVFSCVMVRNSY